MFRSALSGAIGIPGVGRFGISVKPAASGGGGGFSPLSIAGCELWLDATDADTITGSASAVTGWDDKSTAGNDCTASGTEPSQVTINSLNAIRFDAGEHIGRTASITGLDGPDITIFAVVNKQYNETDSWPGIVNRSNTGWSTGWRMASGAADGSSMEFSAAGYTTDVVTISTTTTGADAFHLYTATHEDGGGTKVAYLNNASVDTDTSGLIAGASANALWVGSADSTTTYVMVGSIGELIIYNSVLSSADRLSVSEYLEAKWGFTLT